MQPSSFSPCLLSSLRVIHRPFAGKGQQLWSEPSGILGEGKEISHSGNNEDLKPCRNTGFCSILFAQAWLLRIHLCIQQHLHKPAGKYPRRQIRLIFHLLKNTTTGSLSIIELIGSQQ